MKATYLLLCSALLLASCSDVNSSKNEDDGPLAIKSVTVTTAGYWSGTGFRGSYYVENKSDTYSFNSSRFESEIHTYGRSIQHLAFHMSKNCSEQDSCAIELSINGSNPNELATVPYLNNLVTRSISHTAPIPYSFLVTPIFRGIRSEPYTLHFIP